MILRPIFLVPEPGPCLPTGREGLPIALSRPAFDKLRHYKGNFSTALVYNKKENSGVQKPLPKSRGEPSCEWRLEAGVLELLQDALLVAGEAGGGANLHGHQQVATTTALHLRHALAANADHPAALGALRHLDGEFAR